MRAINYIPFANWDAQQFISPLFPDAILIIVIFEMDGVILLYAAISPIGTIISEFEYETGGIINHRLNLLPESNNFELIFP